MFMPTPTTARIPPGMANRNSKTFTELGKRGGKREKTGLMWQVCRRRGGSGLAINQSFCFGLQRVGDDPITPIVAQIAAAQFWQLFLDDPAAIGQGSDCFVRFSRFELAHATNPLSPAFGLRKFLIRAYT